MEQVDTLIVGAGVSGLAAAATLQTADYLVIEADREIGGYCKTIERAGFTWDYSGHFFHFKHPQIERWLRDRMGDHPVRVVHKRAFIDYQGTRVDFPFQKNIHQLPKPDFIECLTDLYFADAARSAGRAPPERSFLDMLSARFGRATCDRFLVPYNEKLYACALDELDKDAMGRFFPYASLADVMRNMREPDNASYNQSFSYPQGGAIQYVQALASAVRKDAICTQEALCGLDLSHHLARTSRRELHYRRLISSMPLSRLLPLTGLSYDREAFSWNKVLVFNLGFDRKGPSDVHWMYYPDRSLVFYRVGFYDNIFETDRMSLYVEIGLRADAVVDIGALRARVLADLRRVGVVADHVLVAEHQVLMDPAYVHISQRGSAEAERVRRELAAHDVYSIGRYGAWTYCSIEDNIVEARALVERLR